MIYLSLAEMMSRRLPISIRIKQRRSRVRVWAAQSCAGESTVLRPPSPLTTSLPAINHTYRSPFATLSSLSPQDQVIKAAAVVVAQRWRTAEISWSPGANNITLARGWPAGGWPGCMTRGVGGTRSPWATTLCPGHSLFSTPLPLSRGLCVCSTIRYTLPHYLRRQSTRIVYCKILLCGVI